jgi:ABC-type transport system involved in multi-copper enzyme maturation permease subunit
VWATSFTFWIFFKFTFHFLTFFQAFSLPSNVPSTIKATILPTWWSKEMNIERIEWSWSGLDWIALAHCCNLEILAQKKGFLPQKKIHLNCPRILAQNLPLILFVYLAVPPILDLHFYIKIANCLLPV